MPSDTGAPWLLPYPEDTDLVRDGADDIEALATAVASGLTAANTGIGTNVVLGTRGSLFNTSSTSFVTVPDLAVTITPTTATSKVLVVFVGGVQHVELNSEISLRLTATSGSTNIALASAYSEFGGNQIYPGSGMVLHSPASTSAVTYQVEVQRSFGTGTVGVRGSSRIVAIEVAA